MNTISFEVKGRTLAEIEVEVAHVLSALAGDDENSRTALLTADRDVLLHPDLVARQGSGGTYVYQWDANVTVRSP